MAKKSAPATSNQPKLKKLQRLSLYFFNRPRQTALIWLIIAVFGVASYATLLKREGFPAIETPFAVANGTYLVNDPDKVDAEVSKPLSDYLLKQDGVKAVQAQSLTNFYNVVVSYEEGVNAKAKSHDLSKQINSKKLLPAQATLKFEPYEFGFTQDGADLVIAFYDPSGKASTQQLTDQAKEAAKFIQDKNLPLVSKVSAIDPFELAKNPLTGSQESSQNSFDRYGKRQGDDNKFYNSVVIGVQAKEGADNLELDEQVRSAVADLNKQERFKAYNTEISASFAPQIVAQVNELQTALLEGLIAVLIVGSLVIAIRASLMTVLAMITVILAVNALMYLIGYSLNTITLFALILGLSLIVDDTIIMVEAIDAQRRKHKKGEDVIRVATGKVSRAMVAATSTSALSFAPLLFVGGILGSFIRAIPVTIISSLLISLIVALVFIPLFARFVLLGKKQTGSQANIGAASLEASIARFVSGPMLWAKGSTKKLLGVGLIALVIGFGFIGAGGYLMQKVEFNIFPSGKDTNQIAINLKFKPNTDIEQAQAIADDVDALVDKTVASNFVRGSYYGQASIQSGLLYIDLLDYKEREVTAPQLLDQLNAKFEDFKAADAEAISVDAGPPPAEFTVQVKSSQNRQAATKLATDIMDYLRDDAELKRPDGSIAKIKNVSVANTSIINRDDGQAIVTVTASFVDKDTSTIVTLAQDAVKKEFNPSKVQSYGLSKDAISFDTGQEEENQDSFKTLAMAFPILLLVIYLVLSLEFRSLLQPLLIFMAIPFSLFGITLGLYLTDNPFSFFAMLGFFALIGLSIKNTILLTDYANQARAAGMGTVDSAHEALAERFRPLIATSLTAVFSLIPLTLSSPFWEGLGVVLICGLLSSTFLVITVFPYYYLGAEYIRQRFNRRTGLSWLVLTIAFAVLLAKAGPAALAAPFLSGIFIKGIKRAAGRRKA